MSDTPETDANCWREGTSEWVAANFARKLERERDEARSWAEAAWAKSDRAEKMLRIAAAKADQYRRALELIAEDCEAWLNSESDEPSAELIKLVAKYARESIK